MEREWLLPGFVPREAMGHHDKNNFSVVGMKAPGACGREKQAQEVGADTSHRNRVAKASQGSRHGGGGRVCGAFLRLQLLEVLCPWG